MRYPAPRFRPMDGGLLRRPQTTPQGCQNVSKAHNVDTEAFSNGHGGAPKAEFDAVSHSDLLIG